MRASIPGYEGRYEITDTGEVISLLGVEERVLKAYWSDTNWRDRHSRVALHKGDGSPQKTFLVHQLVASAFLPPKPSPVHEIRHLDGDHRNNHAVNLEWSTRRVNTLDQVRDGVHNNSSKTHCKNGHKFTPENTVERSDGKGRRCVACDRAAKKRWYENQQSK